MSLNQTVKAEPVTPSVPPGHVTISSSELNKLLEVVQSSQANAANHSSRQSYTGFGALTPGGGMQSHESDLQSLPSVPVRSPGEVALSASGNRVASGR